MSLHPKLSVEAQALKEIASRLESMAHSEGAGDPTTLGWWQQSHHALEMKLKQAQDELEQLRAHSAALEQRLQQSAGQAGASQDLMLRLRQADQRANEAEVKLSKLQKEHGELAHRIQESQREVERLAYQDRLTGLPNANLLDQQIRKVFEQGRSGAILLLLDLDRFKVINDAFGHRAGDELLVKVAERLQTSLGGVGSVARRGEDEFMVFLSPAQSEGAQGMIHWAEVVGQRLLGEFSAPFVVSGQKVFVGVSIGASTCPGDAEAPEQLLAHADTALYRAKEKSHPKYQLFTREISAHQVRSASLEQHLQYAVSAGELFLEYQPVVEFQKGRTSSTAKVVGAEALLRWNHRLEGLLQPGEFLPAAEASGAIVEIGRWILGEVCRQLALWRAEGLNLFVCLNLSGRQLLQADLCDDLLHAISEHRLEPSSLVLDVQEDMSPMNADRVETTLRDLNRAGFPVAVENYGMGFSSLVRLAQAQLLKLAPKLVVASGEDTFERACRGAVATASGLGVPAVAVGVEEAKQARRMAELGCRYAQGYLYSAPVSPPQFLELAKGSGWKV